MRKGTDRWTYSQNVESKNWEAPPNMSYEPKRSSGCRVSASPPASRFFFLSPAPRVSAFPPAPRVFFFFSRAFPVQVQEDGEDQVGPHLIKLVEPKLKGPLGCLDPPKKKQRRNTRKKIQNVPKKKKKEQKQKKKKKGGGQKQETWVPSKGAPQKKETHTPMAPFFSRICLKRLGLPI